MIFLGYLWQKYYLCYVGYILLHQHYLTNISYCTLCYIVKSALCKFHTFVSHFCFESLKVRCLLPGTFLCKMMSSRHFYFKSFINWYVSFQTNMLLKWSCRFLMNVFMENIKTMLRLSCPSVVTCNVTHITDISYTLKAFLFWMFY